MIAARRLPVYLVVDCSESMAGALFQGVQRGLDSLVSELKNDPNSIETVWLSLITFSHKAQVAVPLTEILQFKVPALRLGVGTSFGAALRLLRDRLATEVVRQTADRKGDWKPLVMVMTDGEPTDSWESAADELRSEAACPRAKILAVTYGTEVNVGNLERLTPLIYRLDSPDAALLKSFFKWVSQSVRVASSRSPSGTAGNDDMAALPPGVEAGSGANKPTQKDSILLFFRCQKNKAFYLSRFRAIPEEVMAEIRAERALPLATDKYYRGVDATPVADFDFEGSGSALKLSISSESLVSSPPCPYCGNRAWAQCGICGRTFCFADPGKCQCPWCDTWGTYAMATEQFKVERTLG